MLQYCPDDQSLKPNIWRDHGISPCLAETVISGASLTFILIFVTIQLLFYRKYAVRVEHYTLPYSQMFGLQMVLNGIMPAVAIMQMIINLLVFKPAVIYGYMILSFIQEIVVWPLICILILRERNYMLPTIPTRGHGLVLLIFWTGYFAAENFVFLNVRNPHWFFRLSSPEDIINFSIFIGKYLASGCIFFLGLKAPGIPSLRNSESFSRLRPEGEDDDSAERGTSSTGSPFRNIVRKMKLLGPFIWPSKSLRLQTYVLICFGFLGLGRLVNVFVPLYSKLIVDSMTVVTLNSTELQGNWFHLEVGANHLAFRYDLILIYVALKMVQGGGPGGTGLLNNIRSILWISVEQYTTREVQISFFEHLHNLSLRWHLQRKTGEVLRAMDRGTDSINNILNYLIFSILPTIADIIIAIVYLTNYFNWYFGLIVFVTMLLYLIATFTITEWRTKFRRSMNTADNEQRQQAVDSLLNFETVKYYANEQYEADRYRKSILSYQKQEWKVTASVCFLNFVQLILINAGLLIGSLLCVHMVVNNEGGLTVGSYVLFSSYILQLYAPLNYFGTYYRMLQKCFIDMENMLDLFKEELEVQDIPNAPELEGKRGLIEFKDVHFNYIPEKTVLAGVSFTVSAGKTLALVGPSGGGKTSIVRLLFRFYDPTAGEILIDGQNIQNVTQLSLRQRIGVVPQDTVLFNDTISHNIKYGRIGSDDNEMIEAARCACIHDKIAQFPERYDTRVGERGLKLSGGEKQRVAIARTILKNPMIILLDEATSALDTHTERQIQSSLQMLCTDRTSIIVAHRLSTIVHADQILVLKDGCVAESGTHDDLMAKNGVYASMWNEQLKTDTDTSGNGVSAKVEEE